MLIKGAFIYFVFLFAFALSGFSQSKQQRVDSLHIQLIKDSARIFRPRELRPLILLDGRNSFLLKKKVNVQGIQFGAVFKDKHNFGIGFYSVLGAFQSSSTGSGKSKTSDTIKINYFTFFYEYTFYSKGRFEFSVPFEIGAGGHTSVHVDSTDKSVPVTSTKGGFIPVSSGLNATFSIFKWLDFDGMIGYRIALANARKDPNFNFTGAFYSFGFQIKFGYLYRYTKYGLKKIKYKHRIKEINQ